MYYTCQIHDLRNSVEIIEYIITLSTVPIYYNVIMRLDFGFRPFRFLISVLKPAHKN